MAEYSQDHPRPALCDKQAMYSVTNDHLPFHLTGTTGYGPHILRLLKNLSLVSKPRLCLSTYHLYPFKMSMSITSDHCFALICCQ